jgi:hypothetical protein
MLSDNKTKYFNESKMMKAPLHCNLPHPDIIFGTKFNPVSISQSNGNFSHPDIINNNITSNLIKSPINCNLPHPDVLFPKNNMNEDHNKSVINNCEKDKIDLKATADLKKMLNIK